MKAYSAEFRRDVLADCDSGMLARDVANKYRVSESWIRRIKQERREQGKLAPSKTRNRTPKWMAKRDAIIEAIERKPDMTLAELKAEIQSISVRAAMRIRSEFPKVYPGHQPPP
jgi:transposase